MKALEVLKSMLNISSVQMELFEYCLLDDVKEAINELEEYMKPKTCDGCKFRDIVKFVQVESEALECCSVCVRNCYDYYEPKDNA